MSDIPFYKTVMGHRFFERDVPTLVEQLRALNTNLAKIVALLERRAADQPEAGQLPFASSSRISNSATRTRGSSWS